MTVLVTGATGMVGSHVVDRLVARGDKVRALTRSPDAADRLAGVSWVSGDLLDLDALRSAMAGVDTVFLLSANIAEELTATLMALGLAREAGIRGVVYLSVYQGEQFADVAHLNAKFAAERMIVEAGMPVTSLRPTYFAQNDLGLKEALLGGVYPMPLGQRGISIVDVRDIADAAVLELTRRAQAPDPLPPTSYDLVGPDVLSGPAVAEIWSEALHRPVHYRGDDLDAFEQQVRGYRPPWMAYELRQMMHRFQVDGGAATANGLERLTQLLGRPPYRYREMAAAAANDWLATDVRQ